jgi:mediator of RNA polymerase II transcription subunit 13
MMIRPLLYCQLQIHLIHQTSDSHPYLIIHPLLLPTSFLQLRHSLPLPSGTPITLLPYGIPAFFLAKYTGPVTALIKQFRESLQGLGVGGWESSPQTSGSSSEIPMFILAWISVENKQGEDKGIIIIYPSALCLTFVPSASFPCHSSYRQPLNYIPVLPAPLQPSPQVPSALPASATDVGTASSMPTPLAGSPMSAQAPEPPLLPFSLSALHRSAVSSSPSFESLRAFRSLTLSRSKDLQLVAIEVGGYVDAVARERERERERLKREREMSGSRTAAATPTSTSVAGPAPAAFDTPTPGARQYSQPLGASPSQPQPQVQPPQLQVTVNQSQGAMQNFYPSPPQTISAVIPAQAAQTSPIAEVNSLLPTTTSTVRPATDVPSTSAPTTDVDTGASAPASTSTSTNIYDPLNNSLDSTWTAQQQPYLGIGMDMDIDFNLEMSMGFSMGDGGDLGMDYEDAFTEDDFSFFDRPSAGAPTASAIAAETEGTSGSVGGMTTRTGLGVGLGIGLSMTPPAFSHDDQLGGPILNSGSGPGPPLAPPLQQPPTPHSASNSIIHLGASPFDPNAVTPYHLLTTSDLFPPSPGPSVTPFSHSVPPTPTVHLEPDTPSSSTRIFDPIPFAAYHRMLDGKYAVGKFAFPFSLPSPPDEEMTEDLTIQKLGSPKLGTVVLGIVGEKGSGIAANEWKSSYRAATDPRVGVLRKLIGVKRKIFAQGGRDSAGGTNGTKKLMSPAWIREHEDWEGSSSPPKAGVDTRSEVDSESEEDEDDYAESPIISRPSTPPPAYLPLGPTLLSTHFEHSQLLPLSTPLRPPGAAVAPTNITISAPAASVPTPVSPAATMGAASEKSKFLEAAAFTLVTEVVENPLWAEAWCASSLGGRQVSGVWPADVRIISQLLEAVPGLEGPLDIGTLFGLEAHSHESTGSKTAHKTAQQSIRLLETPVISIGKGDAVIQILPTALRFWEKLGLGPRGGQKNATLFVLFEDDGEQRQQQVENWLSSVATIYEVRSTTSS